MTRVPIALVLTLALAACTTSAPPAGPKPELGAWGVDLTGMDPSVKPGDDFFMFVNGKWFAATQIPADRSSIGSFQNLQILSEQRMKDIVGELEKKPVDQLGAEEKQLRDLYDAYTDTDHIEKRGLAPVQQDLDRFASLKTKDDVARAMGSPSVASDSLFGSGIVADAKNPSRYVMTLTQSGLGDAGSRLLPARRSGSRRRRATRTRRISRRCWDWPAERIRRSARPRCLRSKPRSRRPRGPPRIAVTRTRPTTR